MDLEQAQHFLEAARTDYEYAWAAYVAINRKRREDDVANHDVRGPRADVLAAQQVVELARREVDAARRQQSAP
jgi:hypothetical protein